MDYLASGHVEPGGLRMRWTGDRADLEEMVRVRGALRHERRNLGLILGLLGGVVGYGLASRTGEAVLLGSAGLVGALTVILLRPVFISSILRQQPLLTGDCDATVNPGAGLEIGNATQLRRFAWSEIGRVVESDRLFTVILAARPGSFRERLRARGQYVGLPRRGVLPPGSDDSLRALLAAHCRLG